jgi:membrane-associated phospholipid phosphatase
MQRSIQSRIGIEGPPLAVCLAMVVAGAIASAAAHVSAAGLPLAYLATGVAITLLALLCFAFLEVAKLAIVGADDPLRQVVEELRGRWPLLLLPAVGLPVLLASFAAAKSAIPYLVGYSWDGFWAESDRLIFGQDVWRLTHGIFGEPEVPFWQWFYTVGWGGALFGTAAFVPLYAKPRTVCLFFTTMFATWLVGGVLLAYSFSAAGPVFAHLFEPAAGRQFDPLVTALHQQLGNGAVAQTQRYLVSTLYSHVAEKGGGISAMPSMHLAAAAVYVFAAWRTRWFIPAVLFWIIIFIGSAYFGYHYGVDGIAGGLVAGLCWAAASAWYGALDETRTGHAATGLEDYAVSGCYADISARRR